MINLFQPQLGAEELYEIQGVFRTHWIGRGNKVDAFERAWANHVGTTADHIVSTTCATEGLFQIMNLINPKGLEVIMPSISFVGAANAVAANGGRVVFCDNNPRTLNPDFGDIVKKMTSRTVAVVLLHYGGVPSQELYKIADLCQQRGIFLIEDAACAQASWHHERHCGTIGDFGVWSFDAMKIMSTGDGGMIYAKDEEYIKELRLETYLGQDTVSGYQSGEDRWWEFQVVLPGRRAIMNDIAAAIGLSQLEKLPHFVDKREKYWDYYNDELKSLPILLPPPIPAGSESSYYMYWIQTEFSNQRDRLASYLKTRGIYTSYRYYPLHKTTYYGPDVLPGAAVASSNTLNLPLHHGLSYDDVNLVVDAIKDFFDDES